MTGEHELKGTEIIGYDEAKASYFTRLFDNAGNHPEYRASVDGNVWSLEEPQTRATVKVQDGGGKAWLPLCDRFASRMQRAAPS